jgi:formylmethanofuran dehydrogenase subunit E
MIEAKDFYDHGLALHGHKCPAMPIGLRVGAAAETPALPGHRRSSSCH